MAEREAILRLPGEGEEYRYAIATAFGKFGGDKSEGRVSCVETTTPPKAGGPPLHTDDHDEMVVVQTGVMHFRVGEREFDAPMGSVLFVPQGVPHTFANRGSHDVRMLWLFVPAGFERYFEELTRVAPPGAPADPAKVAPVAARYGIEVLGPPLGVD
jgi:mannose-6-phosphate isomerase-like protein (cupin superfamily)